MCLRTVNRKPRIGFFLKNHAEEYGDDKKWDLVFGSPAASAACLAGFWP